MNYVKFLPKAVVESFVDPNSQTAVLISITEPGEDEVVPKSKFMDILRLRFHDVDVSASEEASTKIVAFDLAMAREVEAFVEKHVSASHIIVHCHAGISRSAAVALYLGDKLGIPVFNSSVPVDIAHYGIYNKHVYRMLLAQHYMD